MLQNNEKSAEVLKAEKIVGCRQELCANLFADSG